MTVYMKRTPGRLFSLLAGNWPVYVIVLVVFSCGLLLGSISANNMDHEKTGALNEYINNFIINAGKTIFDSERMATNAIKNNIIMLTAIYILGLTIIGMPVILGILFVRGFVIGFAVTFLTRDLSLKGILFTSAAILPHNLLYIPAICLGASSAIMFGVLLWKRNFNSNITILPRLLQYSVIMLLFSAVAMAAGLVEGYVTPFLTKLAAEYILIGS
ncbi:MAG: stage II sporulation protein M [Bacillota bacterium]